MPKLTRHVCAPSSIGLGTGLAIKTSWHDAWGISAGALIVSAYEPLKGFGLFCSVVVALGLIANSTPAAVRRDRRSRPSVTLTNSVQTGIATPSSVALMTVDISSPLTNMNWLRTTPDMLRAASRR